MKEILFRKALDCFDSYFIGQHECVSIINNYVALDEIEKLLHPKGNDSDKIYSKEFSHALHDLTKIHIIHPVWVSNLMKNIFT